MPLMGTRKKVSVAVKAPKKRKDAVKQSIAK
jgi:hypothetical protein